MNAEDTDRLRVWLDGAGLGPGRSLAMRPLTGGSSNSMYLVDRGDQRWVLRRPNNVAIERANEGMRREYKILAALERTNVPHPSVVALCDDHEVLGCTFYLMERVDGIVAFPPPPALDNERNRGEIAFAMVDSLARVHDVDWRSVGLHDLGRPERFLERQVERWSRQLASYEGRTLPGIHEVMTWLERNRPRDFEPTLMHGDYHMLNVLIGADAPGRVVAIVDWETATIGDPLLDLAGFCEIWCSAANVGWPRRDALIERYGNARGIGKPVDLAYYAVLYNFRLAVLMEGVYQRSLRDPTRPDQHEVGERVLDTVTRARSLVADC
jgi:aminoglycoside phosphotransferase (APT) family kinase protein